MLPCGLWPLAYQLLTEWSLVNEAAGASAYWPVGPSRPNWPTTIPEPTSKRELKFVNCEMDAPCVQRRLANVRQGCCQARRPSERLPRDGCNQQIGTSEPTGRQHCACDGDRMVSGKSRGSLAGSNFSVFHGAPLDFPQTNPKDCKLQRRNGHTGI